jgi:hypothetical protein
MGTPSPLSTLSGALKIADKITVSMETVGDKIGLNSQGWEDARVLTERQAFMVVAIKGQLYSCPSRGRRSLSVSTMTASPKRVTGPTTSNEWRVCSPKSADGRPVYTD